VVPGPLDQRTGGYLYDARMMRELRARGWEVVVHELEGEVPPALGPGPGASPVPASGTGGEDEPAVRHLEAILAALPDGALVLLDGLAMGGMPEPGPLSRQAHRLRLVSLVHHPLFLETGGDPARRQALKEREAAALAHCRGVITTSAHTARQVEALGVPAAAVRVAPPGTEPAPASRGPDPGDPPVFLCVASVVPRKGHDVLVEALARLRTRCPEPWVVQLVGSLNRAPGFAREVEHRIRELGLADRVHLVGEVTEARLQAHYDAASVFVLASHHEGFGMVLTEALARGLPVVATTGGAIPGTLPPGSDHPGGAARLVPPGDAEALAQALADLLDPELRGRAREGALGHAATFPDWVAAAAVLETALRELGGDPPPPRHATFPTTWLALREPVDHRSRAHALLSPLVAFLEAPPSAPPAGKGGGGEGGRGHVVDLGSGTGSNLRYLAPRLDPRREGADPLPWVLVDHDPELLAVAVAVAEAEAGVGAGAGAGAGATRAAGDEGSGGAPSRSVPPVRTVVGDLAAEGIAAMVGARLVTASALLDLVSEGWVDRMVEACRGEGAAALFALSYDGRVAWTPAHPLDAAVMEAVNDHQHQDKGLGPALGPGATAFAARRFREAGFRVGRAASPWVLGPADAPLVRALLDGWVEAAEEMRPDRRQEFRSWGRERQALLEEGRPFTLVVGHEDLLALPPGAGAVEPRASAPGEAP